MISNVSKERDSRLMISIHRLEELISLNNDKYTKLDVLEALKLSITDILNNEDISSCKKLLDMRNSLYTIDDLRAMIMLLYMSINHAYNSIMFQSLKDILTRDIINIELLIEKLTPYYDYIMCSRIVGVQVRFYVLVQYMVQVTQSGSELYKINNVYFVLRSFSSNIELDNRFTGLVLGEDTNWSLLRYKLDISKCLNVKYCGSKRIFKDIEEKIQTGDLIVHPDFIERYIDKQLWEENFISDITKLIRV